jgi:pyruvate/2-oxoglutarate dehydrogenase complex dihydrolipoamide acyltransferase (E2) component
MRPVFFLVPTLLTVLGCYHNESMPAIQAEVSVAQAAASAAQAAASAAQAAASTTQAHATCATQAASAAPATQAAAPSSDIWISDQLYFGLSSPGGKITDEVWEKFVREEVTRRFHDGLTVWASHGHWKNAQGRAVDEESRIVHVVHSQDPRIDATIDDLIREYKIRFNQESVLRVRTRADVSFNLGRIVLDRKK